MSTLVTYDQHDSIATITMDDGKVNAMSLAMIGELNEALDRAQSDRAVVMLSGRENVFSAGFDLKVLRTGGNDAGEMVRTGFELSHRVLSFPMPVVMACTGHAIAMGAFLLLSGDYRVGAGGPYKLAANEVAIGLTMPRAAVEILRQRLVPAAFNRAVILAETFTPLNAIEAGFVDCVVEPASVRAKALELAASMGTLDMKAHAASKLRARHPALSAIRAAIDDDVASFRNTPT